MNMQYTCTTERAVITVHRPELTPEEREMRMAAIKKAAADLIVATMRAKSKTPA